MTITRHSRLIILGSGPAGVVLSDRLPALDFQLNVGHMFLSPYKVKAWQYIGFSPEFKVLAGGRSGRQSSLTLGRSSLSLGISEAGARSAPLVLDRDRPLPRPFGHPLSVLTERGTGGEVGYSAWIRSKA